MNYWDYIKVEPLLALQQGLSDPGQEPSKDEVLFIVSHQVNELWFKVVLREIAFVRDLFRRNPVPDQDCASAVSSLRRCVTIFEVSTHHWRVVETMGTRDYLGFRDQLIGASGFQSAQLREIEILLGLDDGQRIPYGSESSYQEALRAEDGSASSSLQRVQARIADGPTYRGALYAWLARTPIDGSSEPDHVIAYIERFLQAFEAQSRRLLARAQAQSSDETAAQLLAERYERDIQSARTFMLAKGDDIAEDQRPSLRHLRAALVFIESHRELPRLAWPREVIDATLTLEQSFVVWRQRHARMVERMIGRRTGTGGSGGVDYLDRTALSYRVFNDLWAVRSILLRRELVPMLDHADDYRFRIQD